jgi:hypothetical protein
LGADFVARILKLLILLVAALAGTAAAIYFTGNTARVLGRLLGPDHEWNPARLAPAPDYARAGSWAARPGMDSLALFAPKGTQAGTEDHAVDVFFVHPTGYLNGAQWNSPLDPSSRTEENTRWMMANQASAFSACCNIYAPRYREASIFRYLAASPDIVTRAMDLAYSDVERAFDYYLRHDNRGRPFIIASHSQGTEHAFRLLKNRVDGKALAGQLVAAYIIGSRVLTNTVAATLRTIPVCNDAAETGCFIHWATYGPGATAGPDAQDELVCVNPLTWKRDGGHAAAAAHRGAVPPSGEFSARIWGDDGAQGVVFEPLEEPLPNYTWAECRQGQLIVADQSDTPFSKLTIRAGDNYHGLDYPLFHMDIRANAPDRIAAFRHPAIAAPPSARQAPDRVSSGHRHDHHRADAGRSGMARNEWLL